MQTNKYWGFLFQGVWAQWPWFHTCSQPALCIHVKWSHSIVSDSLWLHWLGPTRLLCPWDFPGNSIRVDCHFLLQGIFPTQGSNPGLLHCRQTLYRLSHQGSACIHEVGWNLWMQSLHVEGRQSKGRTWASSYIGPWSNAPQIPRDNWKTHGRSSREPLSFPPATFYSVRFHSHPSSHLPPQPNEAGTQSLPLST